MERAACEKDREGTAAPARIAQAQPLFHFRPVCVAALGMGGGVLLAGLFPQPAHPLAAGVVLAAALGAYFCGKRAFALFILFAALGLARSGASELPAAPEGTFTLSGRVCERAARTDAGWQTVLDGVSLDGEPYKARVAVTAGFIVEPVYGQRLTLSAALRPPGGYRAKTWRYQGVGALAKGDADTLTITEPQSDWYGGLLALRAAAFERILLLFPESGGVAAAMLLGDKSGLDSEEYERFSAVGVSHLFAVSGLHVSVLAGALYFALRIDRPWLRFFLLAAFLVFYALLTALSPSVLRASVMLLCGALAFPLRRRRDGPSALAAAFILVLLYRPAALLQIGFQLSFSAVYGILLLAPMLQRATRRLGSALSGILSASVAVNLATLPVSALAFGLFQPLSVATNILLLPLVPFFFVPAFLCAALSFVFLPAARFLARLPAFALALILAVVERGGDAALTLPAPSAFACLLYFAALLIASPLCLRPLKTRLVHATALLACAALAWA